MISAQYIKPIAYSLWRIVITSILLVICYLLALSSSSLSLGVEDLSNGLFATSVHAQTNPYTVPDTNPDVPKNLHTWTQTSMIEVIAAMNCQLVGIDMTNPKASCLGVDSETGKIGFMQEGGGAIGVMDHMIGMLFTPPLRTADYFKYVSTTFGIAQPAYAQGVGFQGLTPLVGIWSAFRNISYLIYILIFILIGLAIMLRIKIDPRTVMTIQNQIPKIIISMILVTFSFAISGFLIDMMYVSTHLTYNVIKDAADNMTPSPKLSDLDPSVTQSRTAIGAVGGMGEVFKISAKGAVAIKDIIVDFLGIKHGFLDLLPVKVSLTPPDIKIDFPTWDGQSLFDWIIDTASLYAGFTGFKLGAPFVSAIPGPPIVAGLIAGGLAYVAAESALREVLPFAIGFLIIFIALMWALFRLWFALIKAYVYILVYTVIAPVWIILGLVPGNQTITFGSWIRELLANLSAFPTTLAMFLLGRVFIDTFNGTGQQFFVPPFIGDPAITGAIGSMIGIGVILLTPQVVNIMKDVFKSPQIKYSSAIGQALGVGSPTGIVGSAGTLGTTYFGLTHLTAGLGTLTRRFRG